MIRSKIVQPKRHLVVRTLEINPFDDQLEDRQGTRERDSYRDTHETWLSRLGSYQKANRF